MEKRSGVGAVRRVLRGPEHVALHKVVVAAELVEIHAGGSDHPNVAVRETPAEGEGDPLQAPGEPLGSVGLHSHLLLEVLKHTRKERLFKHNNVKYMMYISINTASDCV